MKSSAPLSATHAAPFGLGMAAGAAVLAERLEADGLVALDDLARTWIDPRWAILVSATVAGAMLMYLARIYLAPVREA